MFVEKELFVIEKKGHYIIYSPKTLSALSITGKILLDLQKCSKTGNFPKGTARDILLKTGFLSETRPQKREPNSAWEYEPTSVTLFTTSDCGLRCVYCFASAGVNRKVMDFPIAKSAIDLIISNSKKKNINSINVSFHGGGEPLYGKSYERVREIISYTKNTASSNDIRVSFSCATNGVLPRKKLNWAVETFNRINLSIDGPPDIQNSQRPLKTGGKSAPFVERTINYLEEKNCNYGIRATISSESVSRLAEIVEYLHNIAPSAKIHIEPLFSCGRCATTGAEAPDPSIFLKEFFVAQDYARKNGVELYNSGASIHRCSEHFCGATKDNFCVTPWGSITSCYEVSLPTDPRGNFFFIGEYNKANKSFDFDRERISVLRERNVSNCNECHDCFMKYACAGDCPAKSALKTGTLFGGFRCRVNKVLGADAIANSIVPID